MLLDKSDKKILVVGQTPPPYGGQAMMTKILVEASFKNIEIIHLRMAYSNSMDQIGRFGVAKIFHLFSLINKALIIKVRNKPDALYYMPAGPKLIPILRDIIFLLIIRRFYKCIIFHFRAAGISEYLSNAHPIIKYLGQLAYNNPRISIQLSILNPPDGLYFRSKKIYYIPNGIKDHYSDYNNKKILNNVIPKILYVGMLEEAKGIFNLLQASNILIENNILHELIFVGKYGSSQIEKNIKLFIEKNDRKTNPRILGQLLGREKWDMYFNADIFCFPSYWGSESFGSVLLEAMQFRLPIVATKWRGIPSIVSDGESGLLVPINDSEALANKLKILLQNADKRKLMGENGRKLYLKNFTQDKWYERMEQSLFDI